MKNDIWASECAACGAGKDHYEPIVSGLCFNCYNYVIYEPIIRNVYRSSETMKAKSDLITINIVSLIFIGFIDWLLYNFNFPFLIFPFLDLFLYYVFYKIGIGDILRRYSELVKKDQEQVQQERLNYIRHREIPLYFGDVKSHL